METLSPDELAYHQAVAARVRAAQAAWQSWSEHLAAKYQLGPGDGIAESGDIVRGKPDPHPGQPPLTSIVPTKTDESAAG